MAVTVQQEVAALYSAIFNRAPDQAGLEFWVNAIEGGDSLVQAAEGFTQHPVFAETYAGMSDSQFVQQLYVNILGGAGDANGIAFWTEKLASGVSKGQVVAEFVQGALSIDLDALLASGELSQAEYDAAVARQDSLTNKANVGLHFVEKFGAATNLSADTDTTTKEGLESDPVYLASQAAIANVTADAASVTAANAAINAAGAPTDLNVAPAFTLTSGLEALSETNQAKVDFLKTLVLDLNDDGTVDVKAGDATEPNVASDLTNAVAGVDALVAGDYTGSSVNVRAALLADQQAANAKDLAAAQKTLAEAEAAVAKVEGLATAIANYESAQDATKAADKAKAVAVAAQAGAEANYESLNSAITIGLDGTIAGVIKSTDGVLALETGVTETTNPGVTDLLAKINANLAAAKALTDAQKAEAAALEVVDNLDLSTAAKTALSAVAVEMGLAATATPTQIAVGVEIDTRYATLKTDATASGLDISSVDATDGIDTTDSQALLVLANNAVAATSNVIEGLGASAAGDNLTSAEITTREGALDAGIATLRTNIAAVAFNTDEATTEGLVAALTAQAVTDKFISATDKIAIDGAFADAQGADNTTTAAAITAATAAVDSNNNINEFDAAVAQYAEDNKTAASAKELDDLVGLDAAYDTAANTNDLYTALNNAKLALLDDKGTASTADDTGIEANIAKLDAALASLSEAQTNADALKAQNDAITAAEKAFTDNGYLKPVTVDGAELATAGADIFVAGAVAGDFSIANFGLLGADVLYVGGATYNSTQIGAGAGETLLTKAGNDSVIEYFLEETATGVDVIVETKAFGSSAADAEVVIELTGLKLADLSVDGGFITLA